MADKPAGPLLQLAFNLVLGGFQLVGGLLVPALLVYFILVRPIVLGGTDEVRIERSRNPEWLVAAVIDSERGPDVQRLAAVNLSTLLDERPDARDAAEARLAAARDAAPEGPTRSALGQYLSLLNHHDILAQQERLRDRVTAIVREGTETFPEVSEFPVLAELTTVDVLIDLRTDDEGLGFSRRLETRDVYSDYYGTAFFGLTRAEMDGLAARAETAALVHRRDSVVGMVSGACQGDAVREYADIYLVSLSEARILAATTVQGLSPAVGTFSTTMIGECDISGGPAPVEEVIALSRR